MISPIISEKKKTLREWKEVDGGLYLGLKGLIVERFGKDRQIDRFIFALRSVELFEHYLICDKKFPLKDIN